MTHGGEARAPTALSRVWLSVPHMSGGELALVHDAFASNWLSSVGPQLDAFEAAMAERLGHGVHCLAVTSGTAAMHLVLRALGVGAGDRIATASMTFAGSVFPTCYQNATPVFLDTDAESYTLDAGLVTEYLTAAAKSGKLPKALIPVHLYGQHANVAPMVEACARYGVTLVEDSAESLGALYRGNETATAADFAILSFNGNKIITTTGGGMVVTKNTEALALMRKWANQSREPAVEYVHKQVGYNYRMSNVLAAIGLGQLRVLDERVAARRGVAERYAAALSGFEGVRLSTEMPWGTHTRWLTVIRWDRTRFPVQPNDIVHNLAKLNIEVRPVWRPMHTQPLFASAEYVGSGNDEQAFATSLCLPSSSSLRLEEQQRVIDALCEIFRDSAG